MTFVMPTGFYRSFQLIIFICVTLIHLLIGLGICLLRSSFFIIVQYAGGLRVTLPYPQITNQTILLAC